jgi:hypothetical protein
MKTANPQGLTIAALAVGLTVSLCGSAGAQAKPEPGHGPEAGVPKAQGRPGATPKRLLPQPRPVEEDAPAASEDAPSRWQGCPDPGRKLELIV